MFRLSDLKPGRMTLFPANGDRSTQIEVGQSLKGLALVWVSKSYDNPAKLYLCVVNDISTTWNMELKVGHFIFFHMSPSTNSYPMGI
jgi:hypothetical protein